MLRITHIYKLPIFVIPVSHRNYVQRATLGWRLFVVVVAGCVAIHAEVAALFGLGIEGVVLGTWLDISNPGSQAVSDAPTRPRQERRAGSNKIPAVEHLDCP